MNRFKEKDLEDIIWAAPIRCYNAGLECMVDHMCGCQVQRFRQPQFGPYGIGDLLEITHSTRPTEIVNIRVIECKRDGIGLAAYGQAKRYLTAAKAALAGFAEAVTRSGAAVEWKCVLIGRYVDADNDFLHILNNDPDCEAYEYEQIGQGVLFKRAGMSYLQHGPHMPSALSVLGYRVEVGAIQARDEVSQLDAEAQVMLNEFVNRGLFDSSADG